MKPEFDRETMELLDSLSKEYVEENGVLPKNRQLARFLIDEMYYTAEEEKERCVPAKKFGK